MSERLFVRLEEDATQGPESGAPADTLRVLPLDLALRPHVAHLMAYRETVAPGVEIVERVLPDGAVRVVFNLGTGGPQGLATGEPTALLIGAQAAPAIVRLHGAMDGLSLTLQAGATVSLFGLPAGEIEGRAVALQDVWPDADSLVERLAQAADDASRAQALQAGLLHRAARKSSGAALAMAAASLMRQAAGRRSVRELAALLGIGERRLQQVFRQQVGLSPRTFGRLARLQGLLRLLRRQPARAAWAGLAADGGYYDQAHLANEFRALCGLTPGEFMRRSISPSSKTAA